MGDKVELWDIVIDLSKGEVEISHSQNQLFTSFNSKYLDTYIDGVIDAAQFDTDESLEEGEDYIRRYKHLLEHRHIHLGTLMQSGFLRSSYDITLCFDTNYVFSLPDVRVCDHDLLAQVLLYGTPHPEEDIFKETNEFEFGDEVLVRSIDIKRVKQILFYSSEANKRLSNHNWLEGVEKVDLSALRKKAIKLYFE